MQHSQSSGGEGCAPAGRARGGAVTGLPAKTADVQKGFPKCPVKCPLRHSYYCDWNHALAPFCL